MFFSVYLPARSTMLTMDVVVVVPPPPPEGLWFFCVRVMVTMVCARLLVSFMLVAATVRLIVPCSMTRSMSAKLVTSTLFNP